MNIIKKNIVAVAAATLVACTTLGITAKKVDTLRYDVTRELVKNDQPALSLLTNFYQEYDAAFESLLDVTNHEDYDAIVARFENLVDTVNQLTTAVSLPINKQALQVFYNDVKGLYDLLKTYEGHAHSAILLGLKIKSNYNHLIPEHIKRRYRYVDFFKAIGHRIQCCNEPHNPCRK